MIDVSRLQGLLDVHDLVTLEVQLVQHLLVALKKQSTIVLDKPTQPTGQAN